MSFDLFRRYLESRLGVDLDSVKPIPLTGWQVVEILWPLNDVFRPHLHAVRRLSYQPDFEDDADRAIETFVLQGNPKAFSGYRPETWRVLLERHQQMLMVALANEAAGNHVTYLPAELQDDARLPALMLALLHEMELPFPVADQGSLELPPGAPPSSLRQQ